MPPPCKLTSGDGHLILSPHLDDAVLSCFDHSMRLREFSPSRVVSVFTQFGEREPAPYHRRVLEASRCATIAEYTRLRWQEDERAMAALGVRVERLGFTDAGFRLGEDGRWLYPIYTKLTPFRIDKPSLPLLERIAEAFAKLNPAGLIWVPLGVGGHIDHVLTRTAAEQAWESERLVYYLDFPYALRPWKYRLEHLALMYRSRSWVASMSAAKRDAIQLYASQAPFLFRGRPRYKERLFFP